MSETETRPGPPLDVNLRVVRAQRNEAWAELQRQDAELSRLRGVVEAVQAIAGRLERLDDEDHRSEEAFVRGRGAGYRHAARSISAALAPVSSSGEGDPAAQQLLRDIFSKHEDDDVPPSSGEAESGGATCATCGGDGFIPEADDPDYPEADVHQTHCPDCPAPVPSGGQADGEGEPKLFRLVRDRDVSGVSGTGLVAWGVRFPDGRVATRWHAEIAQTCTWDSIEHVEAIHGHGGATRVEWLAARPVLSREADDDAVDALHRLSQWIDDGNKGRAPEAITWGRLAKITEEAGEVIAAFIGSTGQNPRKGVTHTAMDVQEELLDVAVTALGAVAHLHGNDGEDVLALLRHKIERVAERALHADVLSGGEQA